MHAVALPCTWSHFHGPHPCPALPCPEIWLLGAAAAGAAREEQAPTHEDARRPRQSLRLFLFRCSCCACWRWRWACHWQQGRCPSGPSCGGPAPARGGSPPLEVDTQTAGGWVEAGPLLTDALAISITQMREALLTV